MFTRKVSENSSFRREANGKLYELFGIDRVEESEQSWRT